MVNWKEIHPDFTEEITQEWIDRGFSKEQCKEWLDINMKSSDSGYCAWLRDEMEEDPENILNYSDDSILREQYSENQSCTNNWQNIHSEFTPELQKEWEDRRFSYEEAEQWINIAGLQPTEAKFAQWLKDRQIDPEWVLNSRESDEDVENLREEYEKHLKDRDNISINTQEWLSRDYLVDRRDNISEEEVKEWYEMGFTIDKIYLVGEWVNRGFVASEVNKWVGVGLELDEFNYSQWLRDVKKFQPESYSNYQDNQYLWEEYIIYNKFNIESFTGSMIREECAECHQNTALKIDEYNIWCWSCNAKHFQEEFKNWKNSSNGNPTQRQ